METHPIGPIPSANLRPSTVDKVSEFQKELDNTFKGYQRLVMEEALQLMCEVHADQEDRPDGIPYVEHPLGVARKVLDGLEKPDFEIVIAALLHDSVEDQARKLSAKIPYSSSLGASEELGALRYIENRFGGRVSKIVASLSNPDFNAVLTESRQEVTSENKNRLYAQHVAEAIKDPDVLPVKLFDFAENAFRLEEVTDPARRLKLTRKYAPVVNVLINSLQNGEHKLNQSVAEELLERLEATYDRMQTYIETS